MKVAILKSQLAAGGGGLEKYTRKIIEAFLQKGCQVTILTIGQPQGIPSECCVVSLKKPFRTTWLKLLQFDRWCLQWLRQNPMDIVFGLERNSYQTHYRAGNGVHVHFMHLRQQTDPWLKRITMPLNPTHHVLKSIEHKAYTHPGLRLLFTNSYMVKNEVLQYYPSVDPKKLFVVHNGVEWSSWQLQFDTGLAQLTEKRKELGLNPERFQFLFIGHGFTRKGLHYLLQGLSILNQTFKEWQLSIVGHDKHTNRFQELAYQLGLSTQVHFYGSQSSTVPFYQAADAVVIPSLYDPFANVTVEALAMGNYIITSPYNGGKEVLTPDTGVIISDLFSPEAVANTLAQALPYRKTFQIADHIRNSVKSLDFSNQLHILMEKTLQTS